MTEPSQQSPPLVSPLQAEVGDRFGVLPNFFRLAGDAPEITANLWGFAKFGYLDNPLPSLFKERLFVYLSRFCEVRYCISRHVGFLVGLGRPAGDSQCPPVTLDAVVRLLRRPLPRGENLDPHLALVEALASPLPRLPEANDPLEEALFACAAHVFLQTPRADRCLAALRGALDGAMIQHLLVFLTFVRTAHFWTKVHPELKLEEDITKLLAVHEALAECVHNDPEAQSCETSQVLINELADLRTERERAESLRGALAKVEEQELQFRNLANSIPQLAWMAHPDGHIFWYNQRWFDYTGTTQEQMEGWGWQSVHDPQVLPRVLEKWKDSIARAESFEMVFPLRGQDGAFHPFLTRIHPVKDSQGQVVRWFGTNTDISEVQRREEELQKIRSRLESTLAAAEIGTWEYDPINNVVQGDRNLAAMFGFSPRVAVAGSLEDYLEAIQPEDRQRVAEVIAQALRVGNTFETNYRLRGKNGETRSVIARGRVERDAGGRAIRMPGVAMDVTGQRRAEAELRESEARWRLALESAELGSWHIDPATNELSTDERFRLIVHGSTSPIDYEQAFAALHDDDRQRIRESIAAAIDPDRLAPYAEEYRVVHPDGSVRWILAKGRANFEQTEENPRVASFDGTVMDITARKLADEALRALAARLSEADRRKDVFLATLAHELRNPLAPIRTGLEVMKLAKDDPVMMEEVRGTMERQAQQMVRLIDDLLEVSRITQGKLELRKCQVSLAEVVRNAVEASQPFVQESNHQLRVTLPPAPILLDADPHRLAQVLANLLNNAAKYTPAGGHIELIAQPQGNEVMVTVKDNGIGIPPELQGGIFEMFSQIDRSLETGYKGLGIGLTLVKRLVEMHGGKVEVHSGGKNQGSEFAVSLPVLPPSVAEPERPPVAENAKPAKLRVLVVDDNADAATTLGMVVKMLGNEVRTAGDGLQGVELAQQFQPHVVLMDIGMPRMNGYEASKAIRQQPWGQAMMLVALTGWGQDDDRQKALDAGFNHHLVKPAEPSELQRIFAQLR